MTAPSLWPGFQEGDDWTLDEKLLLKPPPVQEQLDADWDRLRNPKSPEEEAEAAAASVEIESVGTEKLREFVRGVLCGEVFVSDQVREADMLTMVFMPLAFGAYSDWPEEKMRNIGIFYSYMKDAGPRSINGYPIFSSVAVLNKDDWNRARLAISRQQQQLKDIEL